MHRALLSRSLYASTRITTTRSVTRYSLQHHSTNTHSIPATPVTALNSLTNTLQPIFPRTDVKTPTELSDGLSSMVPSAPNALTWYICGPTVYDVAHIGHARTYVTFDIIHRILSDHFKIPIMMAIGVTDVDDKIINRANEKNIPYNELARYYEDAFFTNLQQLHVNIPNIRLRVSEHIPEIITYIQQIEKRGYCYTVDGSVYFDTQKFASEGYTYGKLKYRDTSKANTGTTTSADTNPDLVDVDTGSSITNASLVNKQDKRHAHDFALWKASKPDEPSWDSPWGKGRPGWHIECSAMTAASLGAHIDIHAGGVDLKFPHHCNEIAQGEACFHWGNSINSTTPQEWCNLWLHTGHLHIAGRKMSKSLKNFISIDEMFAAGHTSDDFRMICLLNHYRSTVDYTVDKFAQARSYFTTIHSMIEMYTRANKTLPATQKVVKPSGLDITLYHEFLDIQQEITTALASDFNTPIVVHKLHVLTNKLTKRIQQSIQDATCVYHPGSILECIKYIVQMYTTLGFTFTNEYQSLISNTISSSSTSGNGTAVAESTVESIGAVRAVVKRAGLALQGKKKSNQQMNTILEKLQTKQILEDDEFAVLQQYITDSRSIGKELMQETDRIRDQIIPEMGYVLKDLPNNEFHVHKEAAK